MSHCTGHMSKPEYWIPITEIPAVMVLWGGPTTTFFPLHEGRVQYGSRKTRSSVEAPRSAFALFFDFDVRFFFDAVEARGCVTSCDAVEEVIFS